MPALTKRSLSKGASALSRLRDVLQAIPAAEVRQLNLNARQTVATIMACLPRARDLVVTAELPELDIAVIDRLPDYCSALLQADVACRTGVRGPNPKVKLLKEATRLRKMLLADATALAACGLLDAGILHHPLNACGYSGTAQNLQVLVSALRTAWPNIQGRTPLTLADLDGANALSLRLMKPSPAERVEGANAHARDLRDRAFTLTHSAYDEVRRGVCYLRWHEGDADRFAPPLRSRPLTQGGAA